MRRLAKRLFGDRAGNIAMIFALLAPVLILAGGGAIDVTNASMRQAQLQQSVDAAAVGAVSRTSPGYQYAMNNMTSDGSVPDAATYGGNPQTVSANTTGIFTANWRPFSNTTTPVLTGGSCGGATFVCKQGAAIKSYVTATSTFSTSFLGLIGRSTINLTAQSEALDNTPTYINYYIIVDASQSMGIAATATDMQNLYNRVSTFGNGTGGEQGCVFGCHVPAYIHCCSGATQSVSNEDMAHLSRYGSKINLRIDSAIQAIQNIVTQAQTSTGSFANIKFALYTMSKYQNGGSGLEITNVAPLSSDYSSLYTEAYNNIGLGNNNAAGYGDSDFSTQIPQFGAVIPANGTGLTAASPLNYVFIITDGLRDINLSNHSDASFDSSLCTPLKSKSQVGVIYTTYIPITNQGLTYNPNATSLEANYLSLAAPYLPPNNPSPSGNIPTSLQACASNSSLYFQASDGPALITAMAQLFAETQKTARIAG